MKTLVKPLTYGRMGNFLFQASAAMAYAWRHGIDFTLPTETGNPRHNPIYLQHLVRHRWNPDDPFIQIDEKTHAFQELPFDPNWVGQKNILLNGYWQSQKYFTGFETQIKNAFLLPAFPPLKGFVSVHVRRGDYLRLAKKHPPVTEQWITEQMKKFPGYHFIFFSDDIPWCRLIYGIRSDVSFSQGRNEVDDLAYMASCEHHICSASTFSWWGAFLGYNPQKRIIMPKHWFTQGHGGLDTSDIVPSEWERA